MADPKKMHELVAEKIIEQLKEGVAPWQKPWNTEGVDYQMPLNAITGNRYQGLNALYLHLFSPFKDPRWATFKQAQANGWQVEKGAKGLMINFVKTHDFKTKLDENKRPVLNKNGQSEKIKVQLNCPIVTRAWVFNAEQIKGVPPLPVREAKETLWEKLGRAEKIIRTSGAKVEHIGGGMAFYSPLFDKINMPDHSQFETADRYYSTLLHELGHWTGHHSRLNRAFIGKFGTPDYAREELRAEIASMMIGSELRIGHDPKQHIAYVESWVKILSDTPYEIHLAASEAQRITDFVLSCEKKQEIKQENTKIQEVSPIVLQAEDKMKNIDSMFAQTLKKAEEIGFELNPRQTKEEAFIEMEEWLRSYHQFMDNLDPGYGLYQPTYPKYEPRLKLDNIDTIAQEQKQEDSGIKRKL